MQSDLQRLEGGDLRSKGEADQVAQDILDDPARFALVFEGIFSSDELIRMRAADAVEKASAINPELLQPHLERLLNEAVLINQQEVEWHVAQMLPRLSLDEPQARAAFDSLRRYFRTSNSRITQAFCVSSGYAIAQAHPALMHDFRGWLMVALQSPSPAVKARARKVADELRELDQRRKV